MILVVGGGPAGLAAAAALRRIGLQAVVLEQAGKPQLTSRGHQVYAVQLRGRDGPPGRIWHRVHHYVQVVGAAAARFAEPVLVGHSLGGLLAQKYLELHPPQGRC